MTIRSRINDWLNGIRTTDARYGRMAYFKNDEWHGRSLRHYGEWSEAEVALWRKIVKRGDTVVDVGAHIGAHTLALSKIVGFFGVVHAFEPQKRVAALLRRNTKDRHVIVHDVALGDGMNTVMMYEAPDYTKRGNFGGVELFTFSATMGQPVIVRRMDELSLGPVTFIKIDVEGMEREVLEGARGLIASSNPVLYVEADRPRKNRKLLGWLTDHGYRSKWHVAPMFNRDNIRHNHKNVFGNCSSISLLAVPPGREFPRDPSLYDINMLDVTDEGVVCRV